MKELEGMHVLVTGNQGYIGPVLTEMLKASKCRVTGLDVMYFGKECELTPQRIPPDHQIIRDVRDVAPSDFEDIDAVIHLAARVHMMRDTATDPELAFRHANTDVTQRLAQAMASGIRHVPSVT